ncbi:MULTISPECIES: vWA domain-containing protein [Flavobacteriaceae]|uniref:VWA domain-containing protein n=2 Tax=Flavobacteriaceae TaxID=49546 RepID=A0A4Y8ASZ7_9FLAO|nr:MULTISPECIES: VWA domain-containing protein [Flavobacteriaceae]TEW73808.1 VWA domain-containing protein [Gramella jeungdoensis]GGK37755.1 BatA protein [Lutibacter litoralis]
MFQNFEFLHPQFLWLLVLIPILAIWLFLVRKKESATLTVSSLKGFEVKPSTLSKLKPFLHVLRLVALTLLIIALARPRNVSVSKRTKTNKGIDIVMAIDVSASMLARDLKPNRLEALKKVATEFVNQRPNDRIGIVVYAGESFTQTPITSDKRIVRNTISDIKWGQLDGGTAIGMGLGSAVNRLKESKAKSKVIILLTDGVNNTGFVDPKTATELAVGLGIKVYTIGLGTNGTASFPYAKDPRTGKLLFRNSPVEIDEELLQYIAKETEGQYFRATDNTKLKAIYEEINKLEKTEIEEFKYYNYQEKYRLLALLAGLLILIEVLLKNTLFKSFI